MLSTAAGEVVPLTSDGDECYVKVLINNENVFIRIDAWAACHECPSSWVRCLSPEGTERRTTPASTTITKTRKCFDVKNSSSPAQTGAAGKRRNTQMLEEVDEPMLAKHWCDHALSAISLVKETGIAVVHSVRCAKFLLVTSQDEEKNVLQSLSSWSPCGGAFDTSTTGKGPKRHRPTEMDDAEMLKDLRGPGKLPLFDGNAADDFLPCV